MYLCSMQSVLVQSIAAASARLFPHPPQPNHQLLHVLELDEILKIKQNTFRTAARHHAFEQLSLG